MLSYWLATEKPPEPHSAAWAEQRTSVTAMASNGAWFGTITSEPGSGGSGITSFMLTTARPDGETEPDWFLLDVRDVPWDGSRGMKLVAPWDGHGMAATQSHGMSFADFPATRLAWPGNWRRYVDVAGPFGATIFTAVILGVVESAMEEASAQLCRRRDSLRPYEQVEWANAEQDSWLMHQAYEGMLRAVETEPAPLRTVVLGKTDAAGLAENCLRRLTRILGGGTLSRHSPFGY